MNMIDKIDKVGLATQRINSTSKKYQTVQFSQGKKRKSSNKKQKFGGNDRELSSASEVSERESII